ncbi:MAG: hypothetical protein C5B57_14060 [Blastocatellia bacterium]|nr:MAG: hypothetical protein C5B57_14060 [Blastocatellia bacterium]
MEFLSWIENSPFPTWVRTTPSIWGYSIILFAHTIGFATVVGLSTVVNLRLLGFARRLPVAPLERFFPIIWAGFWINAASGAVLFAADATTKVTNPVFGIKMALVALAVCDTILLQRIVFRDAKIERSISPLGKCLATASLVLWFGVTTAGRLMTYFDK